MRRGLPDGRGFESRCVSSHRAALRAPSKRRGAHGEPEHAVVSWDCPTHCQSRRKEPANTYTLLILAVRNGAVMDNEKDMEC
jgi:hypothetical protein